MGINIMDADKPENKELDKHRLDKLFKPYNVKEDPDLPDNIMEVRTATGKVLQIKLHN